MCDMCDVCREVYLLLPGMGHVLHLPNNSLLIQPVIAKDSLVYHCRAYNILGTADLPYILYVRSEGVCGVWYICDSQIE